MGRQMKEVTNYSKNLQDTMGIDWRFWMLPWTPKGDHPGGDGINW